MAWEWSAATRRYREKATGKFLSPNRMTTLRNAFADAQAAKTAEIAGRLADGKRTLPEWVGEMRGVIKTTFLDQYVMARGGRGAMTARDWGTLGNLCKAQYAWLNGFAGEVAAGQLTPEQIAARAKLYVASSTQAFERGKCAAFGVRLSQYPGDGMTACRANCRCHLEIQATETDYVWHVYWRLGAAEHCDDCTLLASAWNPLQVSS